MGVLTVFSESLLFYAKAFKQAAQTDQVLYRKGSTLYEDVRAAFNGLIESIITNYRITGDAKAITVPKRLSTDVAHKAAIFMDFAKKHPPFEKVAFLEPKLSTNVNVNIDVKDNLDLKATADLNKIFDSALNAIKNAVLFVQHSATEQLKYLQFMQQLEGLRLPQFEDIYADPLTLALATPPQDEVDALKMPGQSALKNVAHARFSVLNAKELFATGNGRSALESYATAFDEIKSAVNSDRTLAPRTTEMVSDYLRVLNTLSLHPESSKVLLEFKEDLAPKFNNHSTRFVE
jgi:hypothetical protein